MSTLKKEIYITKDKNGFLIVSSPTNPQSLKFELNQSDYIQIINNIQFYLIKDGRLEFDEKYRDTYPYLNISEKIECLKKEIEASDYKVIKCMEAQLLGLTLPYNLEKLYQERESIRDNIRKLEGKING